jgi:hypothetical protein
MNRQIVMGALVIEKDGFWWHPQINIPGLFACELLTSLDACKEVFEKDATDEYWERLIDIYGEQKGGFDYASEPMFACGKSTCPQRLEAYCRTHGLLKQ